MVRISIRNIKRDARKFVKLYGNKYDAIGLAWNKEIKRLWNLGKFSSEEWHKFVRGDLKPKWIKVLGLTLDINSGVIKEIDKVDRIKKGKKWVYQLL